MTKHLRIVAAQLNLTVGDISGNLKKHLDAAALARDTLAADIIIFPELSLIGYPAEDLLLRRAFINEAQDALQQFTREIKGIYSLVGHPRASEGHLYNACSLIYNGSIIAQYCKQRLPNYGVFDECRYFTPGNSSCVVKVGDLPVGIVICEDLWKIGPTRDARTHGAKIILSPNASPFEVDKHEQRVAVLAKRSRHSHIPIIYVNQVGGQDELVFDGGSMAVDAKGQLSQFAGFYNEILFPIDVSVGKTARIEPAPICISHKEERIYQALVLGVRDYINKNRANGALVGISGGIDSALTLAIAVDAIGKERVLGIMLPSRYTADISHSDATELAHNLGVKTETISIEPAFNTLLASLAPSFSNKKPDVTEENIQSRCRAVILMALSNKYGHLVLTTGNRSELAVGYCTLYGDMAGAFAPLKDIPKTMIYRLTEYRNKISPVIPKRTLERPPTAELAFNQKDQDSLPPYPILDAILECYTQKGESIEEIIAQGFDADTVRKVISLIRRNEYKRKQAAIGTHITHKSFGKDWRYPLTNGFKG